MSAQIFVRLDQYEKKLNSPIHGFLFILLWLPMMAMTDAAATQPANSFDVWEYQVEGNSVLSQVAIEKIISSHLGEAKTIDDIESARKALEASYRDAGYPTVLVDIPEQSVNGGVVLLRVIEGKIEHLTISGARYFSPQKLRSEVSSVAEGQVPYLPLMQAELMAVNSAAADRRVTPVLKPGKRLGAMQMELRVRDSLPLHGSIELNDAYSASTSRWRLSAGMRYDNMWQRNQSLSLQFQTSPQKPDEVQVWSGSYVMPVTESQTLAIFGAVNRSRIATVDHVRVLGDGVMLGVRDIVRLGMDASTSHTLTVGADYKDFKDGIAVGSQVEPATTPIRYINFSLNYQQQSRTAASETRFNFGPGFAVRCLLQRTQACEFPSGDSVVSTPSDDPFSCKRANSRSNYIYLRGAASYSHTLPSDYKLSLNTNAQLTDQPLIGNEEFGIGGASTVRGYTESMFLGDYGVRAGVELSSPNWAGKLPTTMSVQQARALVFAEAGAAWVRSALPGQDTREGLVSLGMGARVSFGKGWDTNVDVAVPLRSSGAIRSGDGRIHAVVTYGF